MRARGLALGACILFCGQGVSASAAELFPQGEYSLTKPECGSELFAKIARNRIDFQTYTCTKVTYDQVSSSDGKLVYNVTSPACQGEEDAKAHPDHFQLIVENSALQVIWADGGKSAKAVFCKK